MDLDDLFGDGAELGDDVVVKAQLRFRVHPPQHPVAQDLVDRLVTGYDECLDTICEEVDAVLKHSDIRRSARSQPLVLALGKRIPPDVSKAAGEGQHVYAPGSKGGKWFRDGQGHIRYGEAPNPVYKTRATEQHTTPHIGHYRPNPFMGMSGIDADLTTFLMKHGEKYGFKKPELRFLGSWYGTNQKSGSLFDAFLDCAQMTREDLKGDISQLRFGGQKLTYEEAVFEFFAAQEDLFLGEGGGGDADWNDILNDHIRPLLDSVFSKYETLKENEVFQEDFTSEPDRLRRNFFDNARKNDKSTSDIADHITAGWSPEKQVAEVISGLRMLGLVAKPSTVDDHAYMHDRPHLEDSVTFDDRLLSDHGNPLLARKEKLSSLAASQLMLLYVAAELNRRWDPDTRSYSDEPQADVGPGALGDAAFSALSSKSTEWATAALLARKHLDKVVDRVVVALNQANAHADRPEPKKRGSK